jgi:hypothetical protein
MNIKGLNMIKMIVNLFNAICSYYVYHTLVNIGIM